VLEGLKLTELIVSDMYNVHADLLECVLILHNEDHGLRLLYIAICDALRLG
jgi:hypothetical protein